jgi:hypothetical protein
MPATVFFNVVSASINGVSISEPLTVAITYDSQATHNTSSGSNYSGHLNVGPKSRTATVTGLDPSTMLNAVVAAAGAFNFDYKQAGDDTSNANLSLANGTTTHAVGSSFEWDSGLPGEFGQATATFTLTGSTFTET